MISLSNIEYLILLIVRNVVVEHFLLLSSDYDSEEGDSNISTNFFDELRQIEIQTIFHTFESKHA